MSSAASRPYKVLFVCLGNICRSPAAEGVMRAMAAGMPVEIDSAGTAGYHIGELPDARMRSHAAKRGYPLTHRARQFDAADFERFDLILAMDASNMRNLKALDRKNAFGGKLRMMTDYCTALSVTEVPDPYYGGPEGFEHVIDILEDACRGLLKEISAR